MQRLLKNVKGRKDEARWLVFCLGPIRKQVFMVMWSSNDRSGNHESAITLLKVPVASGGAVKVNLTMGERSAVTILRDAATSLLAKDK